MSSIPRKTITARIDKRGMVRCGRRYQSGGNCNFVIGKLVNWDTFDFIEGTATMAPTNEIVLSADSRIGLFDGWVPGDDGRYRLGMWAQKQYERARRNGEVATYIPRARRGQSMTDTADQMDYHLEGVRLIDEPEARVMCPHCLGEVTIRLDELL